MSSDCGGSDISLSRSYSDLNRRQLEGEYEQTLTKITQLQNELDDIEQKLMSENTQDYVLLINEREELLLQLQRSSTFELDSQKKVCVNFLLVCHDAVLAGITIFTRFTGPS